MIMRGRTEATYSRNVVHVCGIYWFGIKPTHGVHGNKCVEYPAKVPGTEQVCERSDERGLFHT